MCILAHKPKISQQVEKQTKYCESTIGKLSTNCQWMSVSLASHMVACQLAVLIGQKYLQTLLIEDAPGPSHPSLTQWTQAQIDCPLAPSLSLSLGFKAFIKHHACFNTTKTPNRTETAELRIGLGSTETALLLPPSRHIALLREEPAVPGS